MRVPGIKPLACPSGAEIGAESGALQWRGRALCVSAKVTTVCRSCRGVADCGEDFRSGTARGLLVAACAGARFRARGS